MSRQKTRKRKKKSTGGGGWTLPVPRRLSPVSVSLTRNGYPWGLIIPFPDGFTTSQGGFSDRPKNSVNSGRRVRTLEVTPVRLRLESRDLVSPSGVVGDPETLLGILRLLSTLGPSFPLNHFLMYYNRRSMYTSSSPFLCGKRRLFSRLHCPSR